MQPAIQLTFATREDFEAFIARECALRTAALPVELETVKRIDQLERVLCKVVETNQRLNQRVKALEEDTLVTDWASEPVEKVA